MKEMLNLVLVFDQLVQRRDAGLQRPLEAHGPANRAEMKLETQQLALRSTAEQVEQTKPYEETWLVTGCRGLW